MYSLSKVLGAHIFKALLFSTCQKLFGIAAAPPLRLVSKYPILYLANGKVK